MSKKDWKRGGGGGGDNGGHRHGGHRNGGHRGGGGRGGGRDGGSRRDGYNLRPRDGGNVAKKNCKNCGPNNTHYTDQCFKNKNGPNNQNNRVDKKNKFPNEQTQKVICPRCGFTGHTQDRCRAEQATEECLCGCRYHASNRCPFDHDPMERERIISKLTGKICQWCKSDGDGTHDIKTCPEPGKFRDAVFYTIERSYDRLPFCWHCSSADHLTRACEEEEADVDRNEWQSKINKVIQEWKHYDLSLKALTDDDEQMFGSDVGFGYKAPVPEDWPWCIYCQKFALHGNEKPTRFCDKRELNRRLPGASKLETPFELRKNFGPEDAGFFTRSLSDDDSIIREACITPGCRGVVQFNRIADLDSKEQSYCTVCDLWIPHPISRPKSFTDIIEGSVIQVLLQKQQQLAAENNQNGAKPIAHVNRQHRTRPSIALPRALALSTWPETQPPYDDLQVVPPWESLTGRYLMERDASGELLFNHMGNYHTYYPPHMIRLQPHDFQIIRDDNQPINKAGRMGLELMCGGCGTMGVVRDAEGDLVMCGVDWANTAGCGYGREQWWGSGRPDRCQCLTITGRQPKPQWVNR